MCVVAWQILEIRQTESYQFWGSWHDYIKIMFTKVVLVGLSLSWKCRPVYLRYSLKFLQIVYWFKSPLLCRLISCFFSGVPRYPICDCYIRPSRKNCVRAMTNIRHGADTNQAAPLTPLPRGSREEKPERERTNQRQKKDGEARRRRWSCGQCRRQEVDERVRRLY